MSNQAKCILQCRLSETTAGTAEDHYIAMPYAGEWKLSAAYFTPNAAVSVSGNTNQVALQVKQSSTAVVTSQSVQASGTGSLVAGTKLTFAIPASAGASLEFGQGDVLHVDIDKTSSGYAVTGDWTFAFDQIVS
jgi:hypothetical protein|tara:strand:+ start:454 stop:855 length:402 start_codon:yes stop_codon:yes gene_type:complete